MKFKVELIINLDETSGKFKIESNNISIIDIPNPQSGPIATLEKNKISFNKEALKFLNKAEGDRIGIDYSVLSDGLLHPVINLDEGNKITKSGTVSCRGTSNEVLSKYGTEFVIENLDDKFILTNAKFKQLHKEEDPNIKLPSIEEEVDMGSFESVDDLLEELDDSVSTPEHKDFFEVDNADTELKDIDFTSLIE